MTEVISVKFRETGKSYYFSPGEERFVKGDMAVVETARGLKCGDVDIGNHNVDDNAIVKPLRTVIRKATKEDIRVVENNKKREAKAAEIFDKKIAEHKLNMKRIAVEYTFDGKKIIFYYTAPSRVDFRALVKDLASVFKSRIELRQIGVRDEARMLGGLGICGRPFCCKEFLSDFQPVSIKMAKEQGMSLNTSKISGACGRLMCCLKYEQESYDYLLKITPKVGAVVNTKEGRGTVIDVNLLSGRLTVRMDKNPDAAPKTFNRGEVKIVRDGRITVSKSEAEALKDMED